MQAMVTCFIMGVPATSTNTCRQHQTSMKVPENHNRPPKKMARGSSVDLIAIDQQRFGQACSPVTPLPIENDLTLDWAPGLRCKRLLDYPLAPPSLRIILPRRAHVVFLFRCAPEGAGGGDGSTSYVSRRRQHANSGRMKLHSIPTARTCHHKVDFQPYDLVGCFPSQFLQCKTTLRHEIIRLKFQGLNSSLF